MSRIWHDEDDGDVGPPPLRLYDFGPNTKPLPNTEGKTHARHTSEAAPQGDRTPAPGSAARRHGRSDGSHTTERPGTQATQGVRHPGSDAQAGSGHAPGDAAGGSVTELQQRIQRLAQELEQLHSQLRSHPLTPAQLSPLQEASARLHQLKEIVK